MKHKGLYILQRRVQPHVGCEGHHAYLGFKGITFILLVKSENLICDRGGQDLSEYLWIFGLKMTVWTMANGWVTICAMKLTFRCQRP